MEKKKMSSAKKVGIAGGICIVLSFITSPLSAKIGASAAGMILYMLDGFLLPAGVILLVVCLALWLGNKNKKTTQEMNMTGNPDGTGNETQAGQAGAPVRNIPGTAGFIMSIVLLIAAIVMAKFNDKIHHLDVLIVVWGIFVVIGGVLSFIGVTRQSGKGLAITGIVISFVLVLALIGLMGLAMDGFK